MKFQTLCSGSKGNCAVLTGGGATVLIDLGMSVPALEKALGERNIKPEKIDAVFITHEHTDHISGLDAFSKKYGKKVFVHEKGFLETAKKLYWTNHRLTSFGDGPIAAATAFTPHRTPSPPLPPSAGRTGSLLS